MVTKPSQINEHLVIGSTPSKELDIILSNATPIPITISGVEGSAELNQLLNISYDPFILGLTMDVNSDMNASIKIGLSKEGELVSEPTVVKGALFFLITNPETSKTWRSQVPVEVRIGFGGEVDDSGCFAINPSKWDVFTGTDVKSLSVTVQNDCQVAGNDISLRNVQARVVLGTDGELVCRTCHSPHGAADTKSLLVEKNSKDSLCIHCHKDQQAVVGSTHDMKISAPNEKNYLSLMDDEATVLKKIKSAVTDSGSTIEYTPDRKGLANLLTIYSLVTQKPIETLVQQYEGKGYGAFKVDLAQAVSVFSTPFKKK